MKKLLIAATTMLLLGTSSLATAQTKAGARLPAATQSLEIPFEDMTFSDSGYAPYGPRRADDHSNMDIMVSDAYGTGYGGGLWRKRWLLRHEGVRAFRDADADLFEQVGAVSDGSQEGSAGADAGTDPELI